MTYGISAARGTEATTIAAREQATGATVLHQFTFSSTGTVMHVLSVPAAQMTAVAATLRTQSGVVSVAQTGQRRFPTTVTAGYFPNDPYFNGFNALQNIAAGNAAPSTFHVGPYEESAVVPGQWDMHAIQLEQAFAYSQPSNGSGIVNPNALGSASVKIAIIDTGEDPNHPELASKIAYQKCFITGTTASVSNFETDPTGHGTDVAGIAAAATNSRFGFTGAGGNVQIYAYRVFPTPDDSCVSDTSSDPQCSADTADIASAIEDAIAQHVNVISMSLGGEGCGTGTGFAANGDSDVVEGNAVADAINHNIIVVAASGNSGGSGVAAPGCDTGVIAAGASALADGTPNGSGVGGGTSSVPIEYVTSYTQFGSTNTFRSATSWGIVAPGGDPSNAETASGATVDDLHWIENIWTTAPFQSSSSDTSFIGACTNDYPSSTLTTTPDCRTLIAGTSMSAPHVAGVAALILSVSGTYQTPAAMKALLCSTADNIGGNQGCGRLNAYRAMATALSDPVLP